MSCGFLDLEMNHSMLATNGIFFFCSRANVLSCWIFRAAYFIPCGHSYKFIPQSDQYQTRLVFFLLQVENCCWKNASEFRCTIFWTVENFYYRFEHKNNVSKTTKSWQLCTSKSAFYDNPHFKASRLGLLTSEFSIKSSVVPVYWLAFHFNHFL